jgi:hypothetical protein
MQPMVKRSRTKSRRINKEQKRTRLHAADPPDVPNFQGFQAFSGCKTIHFSGAMQGLVNHAGQALVNHADEWRAGENGLTRLFKRFRTRLWQALAHRPGNIIPAWRQGREASNKKRGKPRRVEPCIATRPSFFAGQL